MYHHLKSSVPSPNYPSLTQMTSMTHWVTLSKSSQFPAPVHRKHFSLPFCLLYNGSLRRRSGLYCSKAHQPWFYLRLYWSSWVRSLLKFSAEPLLNQLEKQSRVIAIWNAARVSNAGYLACVIVVIYPPLVCEQTSLHHRSRRWLEDYQHSIWS